MSRLLLLPFFAFAVASNALPGHSKYNDGGEDGAPRIWALLLAGSKGYENYRHQADICHAYQVLRNHGVPDERIVVMMYDDIADNPENPKRGSIYNHPFGLNVYEGVPKDYTGGLVTTEIFLQVLQGNKVTVGSGKVIASGPKDHIFFVFSGNGAPGFIQFPEGQSFFSFDLSDVLKRMRTSHKFAKMVIYMDSSNAGSMFSADSNEHPQVYSMTATNPYDTSYSCYWDAQIKAFLGSQFSVNWMQDSDKVDLNTETIYDQFIRVQKETIHSHVRAYGDMKIANDYVSAFQGSQNANPINLPEVACAPTSNRDLPVTALKNKLDKAGDLNVERSLRYKLKKILRKRYFLEAKMNLTALLVARENAKSLLSAKKPLTNIDCYVTVVQEFNNLCFKLAENPYALHHLHVFVNACELRYKPAEIIKAMKVVCTHPSETRIV